AEAAENLRAMNERGWLGSYGYFEAADFTRSRLRSGHECEMVNCWMAHHQGMSLVAMANALQGSPMRRYFHAEPAVAATERLLQEQAPKAQHKKRNSLLHAEWSRLAIPDFRKLKSAGQSGT
ncbi:MAG: hypothetical protein ACRD4Y_15395, partial [Candidatus Acidiferrales bacterium]